MWFKLLCVFGIILNINIFMREVFKRQILVIWMFCIFTVYLEILVIFLVFNIFFCVYLQFLDFFFFRIFLGLVGVECEEDQVSLDFFGVIIGCLVLIFYFLGSFLDFFIWGNFCFIGVLNCWFEVICQKVVKGKQ